jgi:hypothetical protein
MMADMTPSPDDSPAEIVDGQITAIRIVLTHLNDDGHRYTITSPEVIEGLCVLVVQGLAQLGAAESLLTEDQREVLRSGDVPDYDPHAFTRAALESALVQIEIDEAGLDETDSGT